MFPLAREFFISAYLRVYGLTNLRGRPHVFGVLVVIRVDLGRKRRVELQRAIPSVVWKLGKESVALESN